MAEIKDEAMLVNVRLGIILKHALQTMEDKGCNVCELDFEHIPVIVEIKKKNIIEIKESIE